MRTIVWLIATTLFAVFLATTAGAVTRDDCGPNDIYGVPQYCGTYTQSNGGTLICSCFGNPNETCVDPQTNVQNPVMTLPNGNTTPAPGVCTTGSSFTCNSSSNPNLRCKGDSQCIGTTCCIPQACPANTCGTISDGCGSTELCTTLAGCQLPTLSVDPTWLEVDMQNVSIQHAAPNTNLTMVFTDGYGNEWDVTNPEVGYYGETSSIQTDANGNYAAQWYVDPNTPFGNDGNWTAMFKWQAGGLTVMSNKVQFVVSY